jgi:Holliday junction resolvase RusA-like endonuclease
MREVPYGLLGQEMRTMRVNEFLQILDFWVDGEPRPAGSKRAFLHPHTKRLIVTDDAASKPWRKAVAAAGLIAAGKAGMRGPMDGPMAVEWCFVFERPKFHHRANGEVKSDAPQFPVTQIDLDKLIRCSADALSGIIWRDDSRLVEHHARKVYGPREGMRIVAKALKVESVKEEPVLFEKGAVA